MKMILHVINKVFKMEMGNIYKDEIRNCRIKIKCKHQYKFYMYKVIIFYIEREGKMPKIEKIFRRGRKYTIITVLIVVF